MLCRWTNQYVSRLPIWREMKDTDQTWITYFTCSVRMLHLMSSSLLTFCWGHKNTTWKFDIKLIFLFFNKPKSKKKTICWGVCRAECALVKLLHLLVRNTTRGKSKRTFMKCTCISLEHREHGDALNIELCRLKHFVYRISRLILAELKANCSKDWLKLYLDSLHTDFRIRSVILVRLLCSHLNKRTTPD